VSLPSPNFSTDARNKSIRLGATIWNNGLRLGRYVRSVRIIRKLVLFHQPQVIVNFYEPLMGLYQWFYGKPSTVLSIAHQYVYLHPAFRFPAGSRLQRCMLRHYTRLTAIGSVKLLAISPYDLPLVKKGRINVIPPVLRKEILQAETTDQKFILVYLLNEGYMDEILHWHRRHPETKLHCFTDSKAVREKHKGHWQVDENLSFHALDDRKFQSMLTACSGIATTAGFETVCEAHYLGKPVFMVPVEGHFEQYCNARDFNRIGAGIYDSRFRLERFEGYIPFHASQSSSFRLWVDRSEEMIMKDISSLASLPPGATDTPLPAISMPDDAAPRAIMG
jgi:uncharacterized protein (TIGR00661 family)